MYSVEFTIQETVCSNKTDVSEASKCDIMACEFAVSVTPKGAYLFRFENIFNKIKKFYSICIEHSCKVVFFFQHKGFCTATHTLSMGEEFFDFKCEVYEPQVKTKSF